MTKVLVHRIEVKNCRAIGIYVDIDGTRKVINAKREVLLSAGAIASPTLLQRSGIGHEEHLSKAGIKQKHNLPGVGENLQEHLEVYFQFHCKESITLNSKLNLLSKISENPFS